MPRAAESLCTGMPKHAMQAVVQQDVLLLSKASCSLAECAKTPGWNCSLAGFAWRATVNWALHRVCSECDLIPTCTEQQPLKLPLQALWWAWSHAQRMKGLQGAQEQPHHISNQPRSFRLLRSSSESDLDDLYEQSSQHSQTDTWQRPADDSLYSRQVSNRKSLQAHRLSLSTQRYTPADDGLYNRPVSNRKSLQAHRLSLSAERYTPEVAARIWQSIDGFAYVQEKSLETSPRSYSIDEDDLQDSVGDDEDFSVDDEAKTAELQQLWQHQLQKDAICCRQTPSG